MSFAVVGFQLVSRRLAGPPARSDQSFSPRRSHSAPCDAEPEPDAFSFWRFLPQKPYSSSFFRSSRACSALNEISAAAATVSVGTFAVSSLRTIPSPSRRIAGQFLPPQQKVCVSCPGFSTCSSSSLYSAASPPISCPSRVVHAHLDVALSRPQRSLHEALTRPLGGLSRQESCKKHLLLSTAPPLVWCTRARSTPSRASTCCGKTPWDTGPRAARSRRKHLHTRACGTETCGPTSGGGRERA